MAKGLFASLIVGTILGQIGASSNIPFLINLGNIAKCFLGPCIGAGIAYARQTKPYTIMTSIVVGALASGAVTMADPVILGKGVNIALVVCNPLAVAVVCLAGVEIGKLVEGRTKFDLIIVPVCVIAAGCLVNIYVTPYIESFTSQIGFWINAFTEQQPIVMGLLLGLSLGLIITSPISSAAVCIAIGINGIAAGAALAGCCGQMMGYAACSYRENKISGIIAHGLGTSKLQLPNVVKNPLIWVPTLIASGICGVLAALLKLETTSVGAGMGSCALVGQLQTVQAMGFSLKILLMMIGVYFIAPVAVSLPISEFMRSKRLIKEGDMRI